MVFRLINREGYESSLLGVNFVKEVKRTIKNVGNGIRGKECNPGRPETNPKLLLRYSAEVLYLFFICVLLQDFT